MHRTLLSAKIHNCTLTEANLNYVGSISIDQHLLDAAGILVHEQVQVVNTTNGERLITYVIPAPAHSGEIQLNGAAARLAMPGDRLIVMAYAQLTPEEISTHRPTVVLVDENNRVVEIRGYNNPSETLTWA
ncbi:aspartate 1-decarboxylase [Lyngbya sp. CCY1209]|uniref:aspartate 1-decarboxylase n=1 Tax=Lyngbya sp. CCY1209 TaxID=2886103 RepID=UPI002D203DBF|nr:aspartate 1-decarboxylase [Lyngbya sp. CCY1209]MEB3886721.1 aspartate 1-decarboxylase [Lyngbya sp. CCY1209]